MVASVRRRGDEKRVVGARSREGEYQKRTRVREGCVSTPGRDITN